MGWWKGAELSVIYIFFLIFLYFLISTIISRLFILFYLSFIQEFVCLGASISKVTLKDPAFEVILRDVKHGVV